MTGKKTSPPGRPHRILLAILSLSAGGAERVISEMANWWASRDHEVVILTLWGQDHDHYHLDPKVKRFALDFWRSSRTPWRLLIDRAKLLPEIRRTVKAFRPDAVISFIDLVNIITIVALAGTKIPLIISERIDPRHHAISPFRSLARRLSYRFSSALVVQTESVAGWARTIMPALKIGVIPNFVRQMPEAGHPMDPEAPEGHFVLAMGRLDWQKGHDLLIRAFARMRSRQGEWKLVILGDGPWRTQLEELAMELGVHDAVIMPGVVREPAGWLRNADFFVHPSRYEGFPNALLEAMACGCAVVATDCPSGPAEIVRDGVNGLLVPTEDVTALSRAMSRLMKDARLCQRLGIEAMQVEKTFSLESIMARWDALIEGSARKGV
jgi:GalNAc-alpha-(1->4)-GalNAc-alpha-(1->3)-diNAcBac-PP-undecaprenol alpha-1,4-N-acetyl-D-galactosaminyltransferase